MVTTPTVLILGAGASAHLGYPLGSELIKQLCKTRATPVLDQLPAGWDREDAEHLLHRLSRSGHYSIDAFLETLPEHADLGKYLIARELKECERMETLFSDSGWYQDLFNALLAPGGAASFGDSRLSIITFNYDRSLEVYLHEALVGRFDLDPESVATALEQVPVVHVHGSLGAYPTVSYERVAQPDQLVEISHGISVIHELVDRGERFCNPAFEAAHDLLREAERIFFLGFGFHPDNLRRFQFFEPENTAGKMLRGTSTGMGTAQRAALLDCLAESGIDAQTLPNDGASCNTFFQYTTTLE